MKRSHVITGRACPFCRRELFLIRGRYYEPEAEFPHFCGAMQLLPNFGPRLLECHCGGIVHAWDDGLKTDYLGIHPQRAAIHSCEPVKAPVRPENARQPTRRRLSREAPASTAERPPVQPQQRRGRRVQ